MKAMKSLFLMFVLLLATMIAGAGSALANTAAYTQINNQAKLTYTGGSVQSQKVVVTVALVPSTPNVSILPGTTAAYVGTNSPAITDKITVTSTANGPATYNVNTTLGSISNTNNPTVATGGSIPLGASVTTGTSGTTWLTIPVGQIATVNSITTVNGIGNGSTIVFTGVSGHVYTINNVSVADNGDGLTWKISWSVAQQIPQADVPGVGVLVAEQRTVNVDVLPGSVLSTSSNIAVNVIASASTSGASNSPNVTALNTWTVSSSSLNVSVTKYVRNASSNTSAATAGNAGGTGPASITINSATNTYYTQGVTGAPGDTLEYVVVASNTGPTDLAGSALSDLLPVNYVNLASTLVYIDPTGNATTLSVGTTGQASFNAAATPNLVVNVGTGASSTTAGTIPAGKSVTIVYQTSIR